MPGTGSAARCRAWSPRRTGRSSASRGWRRTRPARPTPASASTASTSRGLHKLTSRIFSDNAASIAAHVAAGFEVVGVQRRHARLDGEWKDCVLVERLLGEAAAG
jgi:beta-phosphoglucomutase-like phosphatase (HAD superfamily)